jgi:hypothetical protein
MSYDALALYANKEERRQLVTQHRASPRVAAAQKKHGSRQQLV